MDDRVIPAAAKEAHLHRILASACFARAEQLRRILRWLGESAFHAATPPTERQIGQAVLGRDANFDPQTDSLVRKEMSRLRRKLAEYYRDEGSAEPLRVQFVNGYQLAFACKESAPSLSDGYPIVVLPLYTSAGLEESAADFYQEFLGRLEDAGTVQLLAQTIARNLGSAGNDPCRSAETLGVQFLIEGMLTRRTHTLQVTLWVVEVATWTARRFYRSVWLNVDQVAEDSAVALNRLLRALPADRGPLLLPEQ